jgi:hypothetical protein
VEHEIDVAVAVHILLMPPRLSTSWI